MMDYREFIESLRISSTGNTEARNRAQKKLLGLRAGDPDRYKEYFERARKETRNQNKIKC